MPTLEEAEVVAELEQPVVKRRIPSKRNREVFTQVLVRERSRTDVGKEFGLSQPRVTQIIEQVQGWLTQVLGADGKNWTPEQRLRYAENFLSLKLEYQLGEAMKAWHESCKPKVQLKERQGADGTLLWTEKITTTQCGKVSFLGTAVRISLAQAKLAGVDVTGKSIREAAAAERAAREARAAKREEARACKVSQASVSPAGSAEKPLCFAPMPDAKKETAMEPVVAVNPVATTTCDEQSAADGASIAAENYDSNRYETSSSYEAEWSDSGSLDEQLMAANLANQETQAELDALEADLSRAKSRLLELVGAN